MMLNKLKANTTIRCNTCNCKLHRTKTIKVSADNKEDAKKEAEAKIEAWIASLKDTNCRTCQSIINDITK
jgi:hypothetical protein